MDGFSAISMALKDMYRMITMGGNAELELVDSLDPFSEGILFSVMPPKKSWKNISNLSGGEKTLSSLALVLPFTCINLHHCTLWMKLMLRWISGMFQLLQIISKSERKMLNLWLFH